MNSLLSVSAYGVILLSEQNEVLWCYETGPAERIYGLDYDSYNQHVLIGFSHKFIEVAIATGEIVHEYEISSNSNLHSLFYHGANEVIYTLTQEDKFQVVTLDGEFVREFSVEKFYTKPNNINESADWTHMNFARKYGNKYYVSLYRHPEYYTKPHTPDGMVLVLDEAFELVEVIEDYVSKPHYVYTKDGQHVLVSNAGSGYNTMYTHGKLDWTLVVKDDHLAEREVPENFKQIKHSVGPHVGIYSNDLKRLFTVIPNLRCARLIDVFTNLVLHEWNVPESIHKGASWGEDPRPFQGILLNEGF